MLNRKLNKALLGLIIVFALNINASAETLFKKGVVVSKYEPASRIGTEILSKGGNAVDAAIAAGYAIGTGEPNGSGIGGGGFALVYIAKTGQLLAIDFRERAPQDINKYPYEFVNGPKAGGVPGVVAGFEYLRKKYGSLDRKTVLEPVIKLARDGAPVNNNLRRAIETRQDVLNKYESSRTVFLPENKIPEIGYKLKQNDLARTFEIIAQNGADEFYKGKLADTIASEIQKSGGIIKKSDLKNYKVYEWKPVCTNYRNKYKVCSFPPPSSGGTCIVEALNILNNFDFSDLEYNSPERLHYTIEALKFSFADRANKLGDPRFSRLPLKELTSQNYADKIAQRIKSSRKAVPSSEIFTVPAREEKPNKLLSFNSLQPRVETTHLTVVDKEGNIVAMTLSNNGPLGSAFVIPKTGILLNDTLDDFSQSDFKANIFGLIGNDKNYPAPYKTPLSSMSPTIVFDLSNKPVYALGSPGGPTIISAVFNTLIALLDYNMPVKQAVESGRVHHQWYPDHVYSEESLISPDQKKNLSEKYGYEFPTRDKAVWKKFYWYVQAVSIDHDKVELTGMSDSRAEQGFVYEK